MHELFSCFKINNLITVRIFGGLGNQLFQFAFGQYLQNKSGLNVNYDFNYFLEDNLREPKKIILMMFYYGAQDHLLENFYMWMIWQAQSYFH